MRTWWVNGVMACVLATLVVPARTRAADAETPEPADVILKKLRPLKGFKVEIAAREPQLRNPVSFCVDAKGRIYVAETYRLHNGVTDIRSHQDWLIDDLACRTIADEEALLRKHLGDAEAARWAKPAEQVRILEDRDGDGIFDESKVFAGGFDGLVSGLGSGVLARGSKVWYTNIPDLWLLQDRDEDGVADERTSLSTGYGVHVSFIGHDMHGLTFGPDGRIYFSIGDRGLNVKTPNGAIECPDTGAVLRCEPDGSNLELYATGLRNPQELTFDNYGNLWTGDNNSDGGDKARLVNVVDGGDSGWRIGYQSLPDRGSWNNEELWHLGDHAASQVPPIEHIGHGPSGIACYPGVGMPSRYDDHFFLCDFPGGVLSFGVKPQGSSFEVVDLHRFLWENYATDVDFSPAGGVYVLDWVYGWDMPNKGRVFRVYDPKIVKSPQVARTRELIATDFAALPLEELSSLVEKQMLLGHPDRRVRQALQFAVASHGMAAYPMLAARAAKAGDQTEQLHLIWALGQIARRDAKAGEALLTLFDSARPDVRGQLAHVVGDARLTALYPRVLALVKDMNARVRFEAVLALSRLGNPDALSEIVALVRHAENKDAYVRHAAVMAMSRLADERRLVEIGSDASAAVRIAALVALRRQKSAEVTHFLDDADAGVVLEAARAINDVPIDAATPALAALLARTPKDDRVVLRAMHAAYRVGGGAHAAGIAAQAARTDASEAVRLLAVRLLEAWGGPAPRDAVTGAYRPMPARPADAARSALAEQFDTLFKGASVAVQARAVHAAGVLKAASLSQRLGAMVTAREVDAGVRSEALTALSALGDPRLSELVESTLREGHPVVARQAVTMLADSPSPDARKKLAEVALSDAPLTTRQAAILALRRVPEGEREAVTLELAERLRDSKLPPELMLETIDLAQGSKNKRVGEMLEAYHKSLADKGLVEKRRELLEGGNPIAGREVFERPAAMCQKCHAVDGRGGAVGPELAGVGALRTRRQLLESLLLPNQEIVPEYRSLIIETDEGTYVGRLMRETARDLLLLDAQNQQITINKPDITDRREGLSAMPTNVTDILSPRDIRDLVAYLASLRQPASQAH